MKNIGTLRSGFISVLSAVGLFTACTKSGELSATKDSSNSVAFADYCADHGWTRCDASPSDIPMTQEHWDVNVAIFREILSSPSTIRLTRETFALASVKRLFSTFGASSLMSFVERIPWSELRTEVDSLVLVNSEEGAALEFNGLKLIAGSEVVVRSNRSGGFTVSGLSLADASGENEQKVISIAFENAGAMTINTSVQTIVDVPVTFFVKEGLVTRANPTAAVTFEVISGLVMDPDFDWRNNANLILPSRNVKKIIELANTLIPDQNAFGAAMESVMANTKQAIFGGQGDQVIAVSLNSAMNCKMNFVNIPILGSTTIDMDFGSGFGLTTLERLDSGAIKSRVYGITTSVGAIQSLEFKDGVMKIKVGAFTLPIDLKSQRQGGGAQLKSMTCE